MELGKMPNRVIKESVWDSPSLAQLDPYYQDQWLRWLLMADDWGCFNADPDVIKGKVYPKRKETINRIIKTRDTFYKAGKLFVWTDNDGRTWGFFVSWDKHQFCNVLGIDDEGKYTKHRRKTPEPPQEELSQYLKTYREFDKVRQSETKFSNPNPNPNPNPKYLCQIKEFFSYYNSKLKEIGWIVRDHILTHKRKRIIESRLKEGASLDDLKLCVDNFIKDDWADRYKYVDLVYCIGIIKNKDMFEKWLNYKSDDKGDDEIIDARKK